MATSSRRGDELLNELGSNIEQPSASEAEILGNLLGSSGWNFETNDGQDNPTDQQDSHFGAAVQTTVTHDQISYLQACGGSEMSSFDFVCPEDNLFNESPLSAPTSSLNLFQVGQGSSGTMLEFIQHSSPSVAEAAFNQLTQGECAIIEPSSNSFITPQTSSEESSSDEESKRSGEDSPNRGSGSYVKNQANDWEHFGARPRDVPPKKDSFSEPSLSLDLTPRGDEGPVALGVHNPLLPEHPEDKQAGPERCELLSIDEVGLLPRLPDTETRETMEYIPQDTEIAFLSDEIRALGEELAQLLVLVKLLVAEIRALQVQRRGKNTFWPFPKDVRKQSGPCTTRGASPDLYRKARLVDSSGSFGHHRLQEISNSLSESEFHRPKGLVRPKLDSFKLAKITEGSELFQELESQGEFSCTHVRDLLEGINRFDRAEKPGSSSYNSNELSGRDSDSPQERDQQEDEWVTEYVSEYSPVSEYYSDTDDRNSDVVEKTSVRTAGIEGDEEVSLGMHSYETSRNSGDEGAVVTLTSENGNDSRSVVSLQLENITGENLSGARNIDQIDTVLNQSISFVSYRLNEWECLGARLRDRPPKADSSAEVPLLDPSLVDLVPHGGPAVSGVANAFLARHAADKYLCESDNNAEEMLAKDSLLPGYSLLELDQRVKEACAMVERVPREREERKEHERQAERLHERREREACPEALEMPSLHQEERSIGMPTNYIVESLDATHYNPQSLAQGIKDARMRISARNPQFRRWWCTCPGEVHHDQDTSPAICKTCFNYRYLGPRQVRVQSGHDECCICHVDGSFGLHLLPCSHKGHLLCIVGLIQHNILHCPSCLHALFPPS